jgi:lipoprotein-anchoring transpeptidase ErfK/SrfK
MGGRIVRRLLLLVSLLAASLTFVANATAVEASPSAGAPAYPGAVTSVPAGHVLPSGGTLVSPNHRFRAYVIRSSGRLVILDAKNHWHWRTPATRRGAHLSVGTDGSLALRTNRRLWTASTTGSGRHNVLRLSNSGELQLTAGTLSVWTDRSGNGCAGAHGRTFVVDLSRQRAWVCSGALQQRTTFITSGATARGDGTPTGTWHIQAKSRNTTLYPADGGAYHVHYWMPYDGAYGIHDSPWQHFAYGSAAYRTKGSHGCVHVPGAMMAWLYHWAKIGTTVHVHH